jgi:cell pole-organizing protein PopZ
MEESCFMEHRDLIPEVMARAAITQALKPPVEIRSQPAAAAGTLDAVFIRAVQDAFALTLHDWVSSHQAEITDRLKPMIRQWMDEHLPSPIEAAVATEVRRSVAARRR